MNRLSDLRYIYIYIYIFSTISFYMLPKIFYSILKMPKYKIQVRFSRMVRISPMFEMLSNILKTLDVTSRFMTVVFYKYILYNITYNITSKKRFALIPLPLCISLRGNSGCILFICLEQLRSFQLNFKPLTKVSIGTF